MFATIFILIDVFVKIIMQTGAFTFQTLERVIKFFAEQLFPFKDKRHLRGGKIAQEKFYPR